MKLTAEGRECADVALRWVRWPRTGRLHLTRIGRELADQYRRKEWERIAWQQVGKREDLSECIWLADQKHL